MRQKGKTVDVLVIGAGSSGGAFTWSLSEAGYDVMCLEQGPWMNPENSPSTQPDWEIHMYSDFNLDPNLRNLPQPPNDCDRCPVRQLEHGGRPGLAGIGPTRSTALLETLPME